MLRKMRRAHLMDVVSRILFLMFLIGVPYLVYQYYLEDYVSGALSTYGEFQQEVERIKELPSNLLNR